MEAESECMSLRSAYDASFTTFYIMALGTLGDALHGNTRTQILPKFSARAYQLQNVCTTYVQTTACTMMSLIVHACTGCHVT